MTIAQRQGESEAEKRARMFHFVSSFAGTEILTGAGTRLWCSYSRTPEERAIAGHASLIKRVVASFDETVAKESLDMEYKTGTCWGPDGMLGSVRLPVPPKHDHAGIVVDKDSVHKQWIDVGLLAKLLGRRKPHDGTSPVGWPFNSGSASVEQSGFQFDFFGWNVGGCDVKDLAAAIISGSKAPLDRDSLVTLQELPRGSAGWSSEKQGTLEIVSHRSDVAWRATGIAFYRDVWSVLQRFSTIRGTWFKLKHLQTGGLVWVGSAHFNPGCTHTQYEKEVSDFLAKAPGGNVPVLCQCDANAAIKWVRDDGKSEPAGLDGKANEILGQLTSKGLGLVPPG
ncbi:unnamed protein product, partial [Symbiodinium necroappetens]